MNFLENYDKVRTSDYWDWVYDLLQRKEYFDDSLSYDDITDLDKCNGNMLGSFSQYIEELMKDQNKQNLAPENNCYIALKNYVHYKDLYFKHILMIGQGACTIVSTILDADFNENDCIVLA